MLIKMAAIVIRSAARVTGGISNTAIFMKKKEGPQSDAKNKSKSKFLSRIVFNGLVEKDHNSQEMGQPPIAIHEVTRSIFFVFIN